MSGMATPVADAYLSAKLSADATLLAQVTGAWRGMPPQGAAHPFVVWQCEAAPVYRTSGTARIWTDVMALVKVVAKSPTVAGAMLTAMNRVDALLDASRGTVAGVGEVVACTLETEVAYSEQINGVIYQHLGGRYRLLVRPAGS